MIIAGTILDYPIEERTPPFAGRAMVNLTLTATATTSDISLEDDGNSLVNHGSINGRVTFYTSDFTGATYAANYFANHGILSNPNGPAFLSSFNSTILTGNFQTILSNSGMIFSETGVAIDSKVVRISVDNSGHIQGALVLGLDADSVVNSNMIKGDITLGAGADQLNNSGTIQGAISGGEGDNLFNNSGTILGIINGSTTQDVLINSGILTGSAFLSDGNNIVTNTGEITGLLTLGAGNDIVNNFGSLLFTVNLGDGTNRLINSGTIQDGLFASLAITGGSGTDRLVNKNAIDGDVDLGNGDDKFINSGSVSGAVTLGGGYDELENTGEIFGNVSLGSSGGVFINAGVVRGNVTLGGSFDTGFLDSSQGAIYGSIVGGGAGNTIKTSDVGNSVFGGGGFDNVRGGTGDDTISTFDGGDLLLGGSGDDKLNGGTGADIMAGGAGDDEYTVDDAGDFVTEVRQGGNGHDFVRVVAGVSFDLTNKAQARGEIEDLFMDGLTFLENINGTGNDLDNTITGNDGINTLDGRGGNDQLFGAAGNDVLIGGLGDDILRGMDGNDTILDGEGADVIDGGADVDRVDYVLATSGITAALDNTLTAAGGAAGDSYVSVEILAGSNFADILRGSAVANVIFGRSGDDRIIGAGGPDTLTGNAGNDTFAYDSVSDSAPAARDQINDFTVVAGDGTTFADRIDLSAIDAIAGGGTANDTFAFIGTAAFTAAGQVRITALGATDTLVEVNTTGTSGAEMAIILKNILPTAVFDEDFVL